MRKKLLAKNTFSSLLYQIITILCGFIVPKLILRYYGSEVNGLVNSIAQFLQVIAFMELGVGAVVQSALYKPLAENELDEISRIVASAAKFFRRLAMIMGVYILGLIVIYPFIAKQDFGFLYTAALIASMGISSFTQYYFGVVDRLLLTADQRGYIQYYSQAATLILNTIACVILIRLGSSIHFVKLTTSLIFLLRPVLLRIYVNRRYKINRSITYTGEPIKQKWNGVAQHIAAVVLDSTDTIVLTLFASMSAVSVYSVYFLVIHGVKQLFLSMTNGFHALIGELWAKQEIDTLYSFFEITEWLIHTGTVFVFGCTGVLLVPFVRVYISDITDANYIQPLFSFLLVLAHACHCFRLPYNIMILAGGHYKQTQINYILAAIINIVISVISVKAWGLIGVAVGTLVAMAYQTVWMAYYDSRNFIKWPMKRFAKRVLVDIIIAAISTLLCSMINITAETYYRWAFYAVIVACIWAAVVVIVNMVFYRQELSFAIKRLSGRAEKDVVS